MNLVELRTGLTCILAVSLCGVAGRENGETGTRVEGHTFISPVNPKIRVQVDKKFMYVGSVPFVIDKVAAGKRYVFVRATQKHFIEQMFLIQQEGFLPTSDDTYKYRLMNSAKLGNAEYLHSVILYDNDASIREAPGKEAEVTTRFLAEQGYVMDPEQVMSRVARPVDEQRRHEIVLFCFENLATFGHRLADFPEGSQNLEKELIKKQADENCQKTFRVQD
jgi:hypothetical protein